MITLQQIKESGQKTAYYSAGTLWWTHDPEDVAQATETGRLAMEANMAKTLMRQDIPDEEKNRIRSLYALVKSSTVPCDPSGAPLYMVDLRKWIGQAEKNPDFFGAARLDAFMAAHHQNDGTILFREWARYNDLIIQKRAANGSH